PRLRAPAPPQATGDPLGAAPRPPGRRVVLAFCPRATARVSPLLRPAGPGRRPPGPVLARPAPGAVGADPPVQPHGRSPLPVRPGPVGPGAGGPGGGVLGPSTQPVRARALRRLRRSLVRALGAGRPRLRDRGGPRPRGRGAARSDSMGLDGGLRPDPG